MTVDSNVLTSSEKINFSLRELYNNYGYKPYRMSKFEEYDLYANNKNFLISEKVITFTDTNGKLMALKPDVTLSIIKNCADEPDGLKKVYYAENIYRAEKGANGFCEIMQTGLECFGKVDEKSVAEVVTLAVKSLMTASNKCVLSLSDLSVIEKTANTLGLNAENLSALYKAISEKNAHAIKEICENADDPSCFEFLSELINFKGDGKDATKKLLLLEDKFGGKGIFGDIISVIKNIDDDKVMSRIKIDFSIVGDINYYSGIVFKGFINGVPSAVLSGGRYDKLMKKMSRKSGAIGFAVYLNMLDRIDDANGCGDEYINIALPKGRLGEKVYSAFEKAGFECPAVLESGRKLIFTNESKKLRYFWVKPSDVAIYVERGAADIGVAGKDILLEYAPDVYELLDLKTGECKMAVAGPENFTDDPTKNLRVATKFVRTAREYYQSKGRDIDIITLNGSIEIAPILGLSDVIFDIVETGTTLKENNLKVLETAFPISARLIANKSSCKFKEEKIEEIKNGLKDILGK